MIHPNKEIQEQQAQYLKNCPDDEREHHAQMFRIGNASYFYHKLADDTPLHLLQTYYNDWLEALPPNISEEMKKQGFDNCRLMPSFTLYVNEKNGNDFNEWLKNKISPEDYAAYEKYINED